MSHIPPTDTNQNPWADQESNQAHPHQANNPYATQHATQQAAYQQPNPWGDPSEDYSSSPGPPPNHNQQSQQTQDPYYRPQQPSQNPDQYYQPHQQTPQPYGHQQQQHPALQNTFSPPLPTRTPTNPLETFIPASERGEQREAMEQFELSSASKQSVDDRNVEMLQREFPSLDGSLVAAIYGDSKDLGATREMLGELRES